MSPQAARPLAPLRRPMSAGSLDLHPVEQRAAEIAELLSQIETSYSNASDSIVQEWVPMRVAKIVQESDCVKSFYLVPTLNRPLPRYRAGQHLALSNKQHLSEHGVAGPVLTRLYTLSGVTNPKFWRISVKRQQLAEGQTGDIQKSFSNYLHNHVKAGQTLLTRGPSGNFTMSNVGDAPINLLAAGIGITPMISMIHEAVKSNPRRIVVVFYQTRNPQGTALSNELIQLTQQHPSVRLMFAFSSVPRSEVTYDQTGRIAFIGGRLSADQIAQRLSYQESGHCFLCGPNAWMHDLRDAIVQNGFAPERVQFESFGGDVLKTHEAKLNVTELNKQDSFNIKLSESNAEVQFEPECGTLLDQLQKSGAEVLGGCRSGNCGTCMVKLLAGSVTHGEHSFRDLPKGWILPCVSKPKTDIELEI